MISKTLYILIAVSFIFIGISYNNSPSHSIMSFIIQTIKYNVENDFLINFENYPLNFNILTGEIIVVFLFFFYAFFAKKKFLKLISILFLCLLWIKNLIVLDFVINTTKYLITSIPFIIFIITYLLIFLIKENLTNHNKIY